MFLYNGTFLDLFIVLHFPSHSLEKNIKSACLIICIFYVTNLRVNTEKSNFREHMHLQIFFWVRQMHTFLLHMQLNKLLKYVCKYPLKRKVATGGFCRRYSIAINIGDNKRIKTFSSIRPFLFIAPAQFRSTRPLKKK